MYVYVVHYVNVHDVRYKNPHAMGWAVHRSTDLGPLYHVYEFGQFDMHNNPKVTYFFIT